MTQTEPACRFGLTIKLEMMDQRKDTEHAIPTEFRLYQNAPNPFSASTTIRFAIPTTCRIRLVLHDREHKLIHVLHDGAVPAGEHTICWDGTTASGDRLPDGFYTYWLETQSFVATRKLEINRKLKTNKQKPTRREN